MSTTTLGELYVRHRRQLVAYAGGALGIDDAEDVVHDAFLALLRNGWQPHEHVGALKKAVSYAISHRRRYHLEEQRDLRLTVDLRTEHRATLADPYALADAVCTRLVLRAFLRALEPAELRGLLRSAFVPGPIPARDRSSATNARRRLRTLAAWHGPP